MAAAQPSGPQGRDSPRAPPSRLVPGRLRPLRPSGAGAAAKGRGAETGAAGGVPGPGRPAVGGKRWGGEEEGGGCPAAARRQDGAHGSNVRVVFPLSEDEPGPQYLAPS